MGRLLSWLVIGALASSIVLLGTPGHLEAAINPADSLVLPRPPGNTLLALGPDDLNVTETITSLGGDLYGYTYSFTNAAPESIWHLMIYTPFETFGAGAMGFPEWQGTGTFLDEVAHPYDARNVDADLTHMTNMWFEPYGEGGLATDGSAFLSFLANVAPDPNTLSTYYAYEVAGSYAGDQQGGAFGVAGQGGLVDGYGQTSHTPEPASIVVWSLLLGLAVTVNCRRRRQRAA